VGLGSDYALSYVKCLAQREPHLVAILCRMGFPRQVAVDAANEAIFAAYMVIEAGDVESISDRWQWLIRVAFNKARDICRRRWHARVSLDQDALAVDPFGESEEPVASLDPVRAAFDCLPPSLQELMAYVYLSGHTYAEAAKRFHIGLGVVSARLRRAKRQLRSSLSVYPKFSRARQTSLK
jgi:RNA polymerase sigma factor (sigma-70 family)